MSAELDEADLELENDPLEGQDEPGDDETDDSDENEDDEPDAAEGLTEAPSGARDDLDIEKAIRTLTAEATRHRNRISDVMGEAALELVPCALCEPWLAGWRFDRTPDAERLVEVKKAIGIYGSGELKKDIASLRCDGCDGQGLVSSGSLVAGQEALRCTKCEGRGWIAVGNERTSGGVDPAPRPPAIDAAGEISTPPEVDMWNTPLGHVDYGKAPQYRQFPLPEPPVGTV